LYDGSSINIKAPLGLLNHYDSSYSQKQIDAGNTFEKIYTKEEQSAIVKNIQLKYKHLSEEEVMDSINQGLANANLRSTMIELLETCYS